nr:myrcene synthase, chloroplastic [Quercus suber]
MPLSMALNLLTSLPICNFPIEAFPSKGPIHLKVPISRSGIVPVGPVQCMANSKISKSTDIVRRSANYQAPIWDYDYIQSLRSEYVGEVYTGKINKLKGQVRMMLQKVADPLEQLELIDILQKLGLSYHFECEMKRMLEVLYNNDHGDEWKEENLYAIALKFRLLRQHGYRMSEEVFDSFMEEGSFKGYLCDDTKGILSLYEASFLSLEGENILEEAREFSKKHLQEFINQNKDQNLSIIVSHALELPLHWRISRVEARWFIDVYRSREDMNPILLELAKLDFNMVQATHQEDIKQVSRWWRSIGLAEKLSFVRNRLTESFFWTVGCTFHPQFSYSRRISTKVNLLITVIDDIYDVYGTLDELELFTNAVESWNINAMDELPDYMKLCFLALHNSVNEMAFDTLKEQGFHIIQYFKKADELERGDVPKSIQCYMNETGAREEDAREYIRYLINETWKKMNEERDATSPLSETFIEIVFNLGRMAQCMYQYGDGHGAGNHETKDRLTSLFVQPIPIYKDRHDELLTYKDADLKF